MSTRQAALSPRRANLALATLVMLARGVFAFGSFIGGVAVGSFTVSAAVITGPVVVVAAIPVAWATSYLKPPQAMETAVTEGAAELTPEPV